MPTSLPSLLIAAARRHLIWGIVAAYTLAALTPQWGHAVRDLTLGEMPFSGGRINPTHLLLGILLFCVGLTIRPGDLREVRRFRTSIAWGLAGSWLVPLMALGGLAMAGPAVLGANVWAAFLVGAAVVVAMPPAHSSSVWSQLSGGSAAVTLSIIVLGSLASPILTPLVLGLVSSSTMIDSLSSRQLAESLEVLLAFVVLPAAVGLALRVWLEALFGERLQSPLTAIQGLSLVTLVALNYVNASAARIRLLAEESPRESLAVLLLTAVLCGLVFLLAAGTSRILAKGDARRRSAFLYVTGMKNTGAGLVLAASVLHLSPLAMLVPVFYTLAQHLAAALCDRLSHRPLVPRINPADARPAPRNHPAEFSGRAV